MRATRLWHIAHIDDGADFFASGTKSVGAIFSSGPEALSKGAYVLDMGCGKGWIARSLALLRSDVRVFGVDVAPSMISEAFRSNADVPNLSFCVGDSVSLSVFPSKLFDVVYNYITFQHLPRHIVDQYVSDAARVLKVGGRIIFQVQQKPQDPVSARKPGWAFAVSSTVQSDMPISSRAPFFLVVFPLRRFFSASAFRSSGMLPTACWSRYVHQ